MKKLSGIFLVLCLAIPFLGTYGWMKYQLCQIRQVVKEQMIAGINKEDLVLLKFSRQAENELEWENEREFEYEGTMYDVVEKKQDNYITYYWCWMDDEETQLNALLDNLVTHLMGNMPQNHETQTRLINFLANLYHSRLPDWHLMLTGAETFHSCYQFCYSSVSYKPNTPPPKPG